MRLNPLICTLLIFAGSALSVCAADLNVGFQTFSINDPQGPPVEVGVWYPTRAGVQPTAVETFTQSVARDAAPDGRGLPLVVVSHGNGGGWASHADTGYALASAGFVVAALTHTGDNYRDQSLAVDVANRPRQLKLLVDYMLNTWRNHDRIDPARVGAFGFSSGGFTVLVAGGAVPDLTLIGPHCRAHPDYYDCKLVAHSAAPPVLQNHWTHDARLKAIVAAAPALGFSFGRPGLTGVAASVQLWRAADDHVLPHPDYAQAVADNLPRRPDYRVVDKADHFDFLAPCSPTLVRVAGFICKSAPGFDRTAFHVDFDAAVVAFFRANL